jgi:predicted lipoprotein with Yx(FWY)xxD motif
MPRAWILAPAIAAVALAGCGGSSSSTSSTSAATTSTPTTTSSSVTPAAAAFLAPLTKVSTVVSTVPPNGDVNPYGIVFVPSTVGKLHRGELLVSNFNDKANNQGTGTTIDQIGAAGKRSLFADIDPRALPGSCPGGVGLTTALSVLPGGYVVVGSLPTTNGKSATAKYGCLIVLDSDGHPVSTIAGPNIQGPWDMTSVSSGADTTLFVSMVLNGGAKAGLHVIKNSTVVRIRLQSGIGQPPKILSQQVIADGIPWRDDPSALAIGPTGVALASNGTLYLANTLQNQITAIPNAMTRTTAAPAGGTPVSTGQHLKQPLGLTLAPNGDILTANAGDGNIVETTPAGDQVAVVTADKKTGAGSLFGLVVAPGGRGVYFVDDGDNTLKLLHAAAKRAAVRRRPATHVTHRHSSPKPKSAAVTTHTTTTTTTSTARHASAQPSPATGAVLDARSTALGTVLVDAAGLTLYLFEGDKGSSSSCYGGCASIWPPLTTTGTPVAGAGIKASLLGTAKRKDGTTQVTYAGHPLYRYVADSSPGRTSGQGLNQFGALWFVLAPSGSAIK